MPTPRVGSCAVTLTTERLVLLIGGHDGNLFVLALRVADPRVCLGPGLHTLETSWQFNLDSREWNPYAPLHLPESMRYCESAPLLNTQQQQQHVLAVMGSTTNLSLYRLENYTYGTSFLADTTSLSVTFQQLRSRMLRFRHRDEKMEKEWVSHVAEEG